MARAARAPRKPRQMPAQQPAISKQDYRTPIEFLQAAAHKLAIEWFTIDVAADAENAVADLYYSKDENGLVRSWNPNNPQWEVPIGGIAWCNPEFGQIADWVKKAYQEATNPYESYPPATSAILVPAGVGANWWKEYVHGKARVLLLNGRLCFIHDWETQLWLPGEKIVNGQDLAGARKFPTKPLYPKDCCLLIYGPGIIPAYEVWSWGSETPDMPQRDASGDEPDQDDDEEDHQHDVGNGPGRLRKPEGGDHAVDGPVDEAADHEEQEQRHE